MILIVFVSNNKSINSSTVKKLFKYLKMGLEVLVFKEKTQKNFMRTFKIKVNGYPKAKIPFSLKTKCFLPQSTLTILKQLNKKLCGLVRFTIYLFQ